MYKFGKFVSKNRILVLIIAILLLFPSFYGMAITRINYDMLTYLPEDMDSMKGQELLDNTFSKAATGMLVIEDMEDKDVQVIKEKIEKVEGVESVTWIDDFVDISVPGDFLPEEIRTTFYSDNSTLVTIQFEYPAASKETMDALEGIEKIMDKQCFLSGAASIIKDTKALADKETPIYIALAVALAIIVLALTLESTLIPFIFLASIGIAIMYNFGTNVFLGEISYVTKSLAAVLQLGVTMDYSIFLFHRYDEEKKNTDDRVEAMAKAISASASSVSGSSLTTIAGFAVLVIMQLRLGGDIGIVMAKGVLLGVICTVTVLPALILVFDGPIHKYNHGTILPKFDKMAKFVTDNYKILLLIFIVLFIPAIYGQANTEVYYNLDKSLPEDMQSVVALNKLKEEFNMTTTHMVIVKGDIPSHQVNQMIKRIEQLDGITKAVSYDKYIGSGIPKSFIPQKFVNMFENDGYKLMLVNSKYKAASDELNKQLEDMDNIIKSYDEENVIAGVGALTKDLIEVCDIDFRNVNIASIVAIFVIIMLLFGSISIPIMLVSAIELAIFINMGIPYYTNTSIPFISSIVIGCIQLGATVDYAILLTTRFREEIRNGFKKGEAMYITLKNSAKSIVTSGLTFFAATIGVGIVADIEITSSLTTMIARGAIISMVVILLLLPAVLIATESFISVTSRYWRNKASLTALEREEN
ncbi:MAG: MMPL family transporter [Clostridia bacterium]|nr:MMPL family transporter [Clostridia bacterium]